MKQIFKYSLVLLLLTFYGHSYSQSETQSIDTTTVQSKTVTVYVTNTGTKYHSSNCGYLHSSKIAMSLGKAKESYTACSRCKGSPTYKPKTTSQGTSTSVQCSGTTQAGNRCKRRTTNSNGRCYQH